MPEDASRRELSKSVLRIEKGHSAVVWTPQAQREPAYQQEYLKVVYQKSMAPARGLSPTRAQKVKLYKNVKM